jgi:microcystin degradation protein MlrC
MSENRPRRRVLIGGIAHETHTFISEVTGIDRFDIRRGDAILARRGDGGSVDGFLEVADAEGWDVVAVSEFRGAATGTVEQAVLDQFIAELEAGIAAALAEGPLDGVWLSLHGAMVTDGCIDPEGEVLRRVRRFPALANVPVMGAFDPHATFTDLMAEHASALVGYRNTPHTDIRDTSVRSAKLLARAFAEGRAPIMRARRAPVVWAPTGTGTADRPMKDLEALARRIEAENPEIWVANVIGGYSFSDVPDAGVAFSVATTAGPAVAEAALDRLVAMAVELREFGVPREWDIDEAIARVKGSRGPHLIVEPAENIGGGAPGDGTEVLRAFLRNDVSNAAVIIADPETVEAFAGDAPGTVRRVRIGGKGSPLDLGPVEIEATLVSSSDGRFTLEDRHSHMAANGIHIDMGRSVVLTVNEGKVTILVTSRKTAPMDLGQLRSQGIIPEKLDFIGIKAAVAHRQAYDKIMASTHTVRGRGPCASDIALLPYKRLRRPVFPLDPI